VAPVDKAFKVTAAKEREDLHLPIQVIILREAHRDEVRELVGTSARAVGNRGSSRGGDINRGRYDGRRDDFGSIRVGAERR
jgi:hypothetical protein